MGSPTSVLSRGNKGFHVRVDAAYERQFREYRADDYAVQVPAGHLVKVPGLFVEEHHNEFLVQRQRVGCYSFDCQSHEL